MRIFPVGSTFPIRSLVPAASARRFGAVWPAIKQRAGEAWQAWLTFECTAIAAAVAYYAALSLFPLMLVLMAGVGTFFQFVEKGRDARETILTTVSQQLSPQVGEALGQMLSRVESGALVTGPLAGIMLLFTASLVFLQIDRGFNRIWEVRQRRMPKGVVAAVKRMLLGRLRSLAMLFGMGLVVVLVFVAGLVMRGANAIVREWVPAVEGFSWAGAMLVGLAVNTLVFFLLYRFLSKERVATRNALGVAVGAALLWEIGSRAMGAMSIGAGFSVYGVIGSFLLVQVWIYYNAMVLFAGAVVVRVLTRPLDGSRPKDGQPA